MDAIREYLIGVVAAALLCGMIKTLFSPKGMVGVVLKLVSGLLILLAVVRPWTSVTFDGLFGWADMITADGSGYVHSGEIMADEAYRDSIKKQTQSYIVDEAKAFDCELTVEVILSTDRIPIPTQVRLSGEVSPYARQALTNFMVQQLGLKREDLIWT